LTILIMLGTALPFTTVSAQTNQNSGGMLPQPPSPELSATQISSSTSRTCILPSSSSSHIKGTPQQTEGPYFVDGMPKRSDIRADSADGLTQQGIPLHLVIHVYSVNNNNDLCNPVRGARVDIWHANSQGIYSAVSDQGTAGNKFLRGYQMTDDNGTVRFTTIYPGWYQGRAIHIHDKIRMLNGTEKILDWTSQLYFENSINEQIHKQRPYSNHGLPDVTNEQDGIYTGPSTDHLLQNNSGKYLMLNLTKEGQQSYLGIFDIVLHARQQHKQ
jgi:protocatechuate 3,4-dioxygenase beta subunit